MIIELPTKYRLLICMKELLNFNKISYDEDKTGIRSLFVTNS